MSIESRAQTTPDLPLSPRARKIAIFLSLLLVVHLAIVLITPNKTTYFGWRYARIILPYVNLFELSSGWSFFAPEPGPPPVYMEWELMDKAGNTFTVGRLPDVKDPYFFRDRYNRRIAAARYMANLDTGSDKMLPQWLCANEPRAYSVRLWKLMAGVPGIYDVASGARTIGDEEALDRRAVSLTFCASGLGGGK